MRAVDLIRQKRDGAILSPDAIRAFVAGVTDGSWPDYQTAAMLMAIAIRGMTLDEAAALTDAMVRSGQRLDLAEFGGAVVDKHSTGGVGDKISLVAAPLAVACGAVVPMVSGRGLGHTGGTLDKLEAIPGFRTRLAAADAKRVLATTGCVLMGQTDEIAPADRRLYALRDVTGTVESVPLIAASILSKKVASGIAALVLDVKVGRGAFMKTIEDARTLAGWLVALAGRHDVRAEALLTSMDAPLGRAVGNANEVAEAVATLKGSGPADVTELSVEIATRMVRLAGLSRPPDDARARVTRALDSGAGLETFRNVIAAQGGDPAVVDDPRRLPRAATSQDWTAPRPGVVARLDAERIGLGAVALGAGRQRVEDPVDPAAGLDVLRAVGDEVASGEPVLRLFAADRGKIATAIGILEGAIVITDEPPAPAPVLLEAVTAADAVAHG
jgi:pyrimidine-nucleoside phosphorylase